jgi:MarR family transcriptional regulator, organic hydroperoxide resistance regulator
MADRNRAPPPNADAGREAWQLLFGLLQDDKGSVQDVWSEFELSPAQANLLHRLVPEKGLPMIGLAEALHCQASNVTGLVDKLESRGLIERRVDPKDRRVKVIALTAAGRRFRAKLLERLSEPPPFIASLSDEDKHALRDILGRSVSQRSGR